MEDKLDACVDHAKQAQAGRTREHAHAETLYSQLVSTA